MEAEDSLILVGTANCSVLHKKLLQHSSLTENTVSSMS